MDAATTLWVLWLWFAYPHQTIGPPMSAGWESVAPMSREACLDLLRHQPASMPPATCVPAGILLRPLARHPNEPPSATIQPYAEFDVAPEFK